jgi:hypothetical protein
MIDYGFTENEIVIRIRCSPEVVAKIREQMRLEKDEE